MHNSLCHKKSIVIGLSTVLMFGLIFASEALARSSHNNWKIEAGGQTIGGPGLVKVYPNEAVSVFELPRGQARPLCVTGHNKGRGKASISIGGDTEGGPASTAVDAQQTRTICGEGTLVTVACEVDRCRVMWRVDDLR